MTGAPLVDFDYLYEIAHNDAGYIHDVLEIFLSSTPPGIAQLEQMVENGEDWDAISKQAHFLKSSVSIIRIRGLYDELAEIERLTMQKESGGDPVDKETVVNLLRSIRHTYDEAHPLLLEVMNKHKRP